ncbi:hypothetical protein ASPZODRAFT_132338 [Penicilliopsis zonata CBS 506.65]|uniref:Uncharacterized protein n=1 Tax=Penicilliopsis zonata CBS 506.65 TaxID=1073090 RepID=A0A1L9SJS7_9EURO|nr:hypothetical protein ASPZODRAFT_132338 [Penicilliopsis zonata CBS 506.65]OJJ47336.1 hypothetical protein ASPZODRAFT_132338 [Penicilliopsis zonata CBS 506.65]
MLLLLGLASMAAAWTMSTPYGDHEGSAALECTVVDYPTGSSIGVTGLEAGQVVTLWETSSCTGGKVHVFETDGSVDTTAETLAFNVLS